MYFAALFLLMCTTFTVLALVRHPIYGLYFYFAATFVYPPARWWGSMLGETRWSMIAAVVTVIAVLVHSGKLARKPVWLSTVPAVIFVLYTGWMWVQYPWAQDQEAHLNASWQFLKYLVAFWFIYRIVETRERARDVLFAHLMGCTLLGLYALETGRFIRDRLDGVGGPGMDDANTLGMYFATAVIVALGMVMTQRDWRRWVSLAALAIVANGLVLTNTRGAVLGLVAGALVLLLTKSGVHRRAFWVICLVGFFGAILVVDQKFIERMSTLREAWSDTTEIDDSAQSRLALLDAQFQMFHDYRMGTGHRGTEALSTKYLDKQWLSHDEKGVAGTRSSHNTFMTALVEQGIPGAALFVWLVLWTMFTLLRSRAKEAQHGDPELTTLIATIGGALAVIFVAGNTADFLMAEVQFWLFAALVCVVQFARAGRRFSQHHQDPAAQDFQAG